MAHWSLGPIGVGKTHLASALGHIAIRRRMTVHAAPADKLFTRLRASRLDNTLEAELRELAHVDLLILVDFAGGTPIPPSTGWPPALTPWSSRPLLPTKTFTAASRH
jgi:hypothetical protein